MGDDHDENDIDNDNDSNNSMSYEERDEMNRPVARRDGNESALSKRFNFLREVKRSSREKIRKSRVQISIFMERTKRFLIAFFDNLVVERDPRQIAVHVAESLALFSTSVLWYVIGELPLNFFLGFVAFI